MLPIVYCQWTVESFKDGRIGRKLFEARTPQGAAMWIRLGLRTVVSGFDPATAEAAFDWLDHGQDESLTVIRRGEPFILRAPCGDGESAWSARTVLGLPVVGGCTCPSGRSDLSPPMPPPASVRHHAGETSQGP